MVDGGDAEPEDKASRPVADAPVAAPRPAPPPAPWQGTWRPEAVLPEHLAQAAQRLPVAQSDPELLERGLAALGRWHKRFPTQVWGRMTKTGEGSTKHMPKVLKEFDEVAPILRQVERWIMELPPDAPPASVVDLCSGFGFLGMFLAEIIPDAERHLAEIILVDRGWPNPHIGSKGTISNEHIYDHGAWRVPMQTIKMDIKEQSNVRSLVRRVLAYQDRPCFICAVHLCGTLSLRAVQLFNATERAQALALVPCCMPPKRHAIQEVVYELGGHTFSAQGVRDTDKNGSATARFHSWVENVQMAVDPGENGEKWLKTIRVHSSGRHSKSEAYSQDLHIFACRAPWSSLGPRKPVEEEVAATGAPVVKEGRFMARKSSSKEPGDEQEAAPGEEAGSAQPGAVSPSERQAGSAEQGALAESAGP